MRYQPQKSHYSDYHCESATSQPSPTYFDFNILTSNLKNPTKASEPMFYVGALRHFHMQIPPPHSKSRVGSQVVLKLMGVGANPQKL